MLNRPLALKRYREHDPHHDALIKRGPKEPPAHTLAHNEIIQPELPLNDDSNDR
ncbi:MAG: hypothetical protein RMJ54_17490 [Roseiflexaceae bacterium]|nr:hypothetical protein [Roseiflexaceae bacterium]